MLRGQTLLVLAIALFASPICGDYEAITEEFGADAASHCIKKCQFQNRTGDGQFEMTCGTACNIEQCSAGCQLWRQGLDSSCQIVCNVSAEAGDLVSQKELYCVMGCNEALDHYFHKLGDVIGTPSAPALVADSLTSTSLSLEWQGSKYSNLSYLVQWRYEQVAGDWQYCRNQSWDEHSTVKVDNLQPYTKYRFRVAILLSRRETAVSPIVSQASVVISTLAAGQPSAAVVGLRAAAVDAHRVSLSWEPGQFSNGPILSYVLRISNGTPNGYLALEDLPASDHTLFYIFRNLAPLNTYTVSVAMKNAEGEGPQASIRVTTPDRSTVTIPGEREQPRLLLGGDHTVLQQAADMLAAPILLYTTLNTIEGLAIDVGLELVFIAESDSGVWQSVVGGKGPRKRVLEAQRGWHTLALMADWLNRHLYVISESTTRDTRWRILRSDYDGKGQLQTYEEFSSEPLHTQVDPYNGYLFWVSHEGLHRIDLADLANPAHGKQSECILKDEWLGAFVVDHTNFRVLVSHLKRNTMLSVSLDGREVVNFRNNTPKPMFQSVEALAFADGLFYWTNGAEVLTEEYHSGQNNYFHNAYPNLSDEHFNTILVALHSCQPIPIPVNPPLRLQAVLGTTHAKVSWQAPHLLGHQGNGAWQHWRYDLQITDLLHNQTTHRTGINNTSNLIVKDLRENTQYVIKVAAITVSGAGPWSSEFVGKTLSSSSSVLHSSILWSGKEGLLQTDLTGDNVQVVLSKAYLDADTHISDIAWYRDKLYLLMNGSTVMWYNRTSQQRGWIPTMENVGSLAVDWVGKRLYWSNPKQQLITRGNLNGSNCEPVPIVTIAKELKIDSLSGHIYWNTGHAVECARLNGEHRFTYYPAQLFSGKQVMGLTVDLEGNNVYWIVRSNEGSDLYKAPTADFIAHGEESFNYLVEDAAIGAALGPLCHFGERLLWLQNTTHAVIADLAGHNAATINVAHMAAVHVIAVVDSSLHSRADYMNAIPEAINMSSIEIRGRWNAFNISWAPTRTVTHGDVFYDFTVNFVGHNQIEQIQRGASFEVTSGSPPPYSRVEVTVRAHTYWGSGAAARVALYTPPGLPSHPTSPRIFIYQSDEQKKHIWAVFRWTPPAQSNGEIRGYRVQCWQGSQTEPCRDGEEDRKTQRTQYTITNLLPNVTYFFQVGAFTDAGEGPLSHSITAHTDIETPIPTLLVSTPDSVQLVDLDLGVVTQTMGIRSAGPVDVAVSVRERLVYWLSDMQEIFVSKMNEMAQTKVTSMNGTGLSVCLDWVSRALYWVQSEEAVTGSGAGAGCAVYRLQLDGSAGRSRDVRRVLARKAHMYSLNINPATRSLYWIEKHEHNFGTLMRSDTNGKNVKSVLGGKGCDCPWGQRVGKVLSLDFSVSEGRLYWVDARHHHIMTSNLNGCSCCVLLNSTGQTDAGLPPSDLTVDGKYIYWLNESQKMIYYIDKTHISPQIFSVAIASGQKIFGLGSKIQPMPSYECLTPKQVPLRVTLTDKTATSLQLKLPDVQRYSTCEQVDMATPYYKVYYRPHEKEENFACDESRCTAIETYQNNITLDGLRPFTNYSISLKVNNYYGVLRDIKPILGPSVVLRTAAEAPGAARDVHAVVLSPRAARVEWRAPDALSAPHAPDYIFEVHWRTEDALASAPGQKQKLNEHSMLVTLPKPHMNKTFARLSRLQAGQQYIVWVRTVSRYAALGNHTDSAAVTLHTYTEPRNITVQNIQPYVIRVSWVPYTNVNIVQHSIEFSELSLESWYKTSEEETYSANWSYVAAGLQPNTHYKFRVNVQYVEDGLHYLWPQDTRFTYQTLGDVPGAPGRPHLQRVSPSLYKLQWSHAAPHGSPVILYAVWGRASLTHQQKIKTTTNTTLLKQDNLKFITMDNSEPTFEAASTEDWKIIHNVTEPYWIMSKLNQSEHYTFRVEALNDYGWSQSSEACKESEIDDAGAMASQQESLSIILGVGLPVLAACSVLILSAVFCVLRNDGKKKSVTSICIGGEIQRPVPDVELATLRELPRSGNGLFPHSTNVLYNIATNNAGDAELAALPHIRRDQITLTKFLGSGAFGEVFQGKANNLDFQRNETRVAVKTLRKGATEQEKTEFLQEAQLMSNFKHKHIMRLLGVCLDNDPNFIIMELMEDGDLLSYLRTKRTLLFSPSSLSLLDLLSMCLDVTRGCRYLEEMHFVHRDLAARNCLVSHGPQGRVVKIGDFGLARDIYNNDYYRKEGEGLLPVRWMAVECLIDGVFSCQSDVWAWGVLCWEVLSLGQQPYPARTNHQVLTYVRQGGVPGRPPNCPDLLYELLQECWSYRPDERPTFLHCLQVMQQLHASTEPHVTLLASLPPASPHHYLTLIPDDVSFDLRERPNMQQCLATSKYLELLSDDNQVLGLTTCSQGYEIPRTAPAMTGSQVASARHSMLADSHYTASDSQLARSASLRIQPSPRIYHPHLKLISPTSNILNRQIAIYNNGEILAQLNKINKLPAE